METSSEKLLQVEHGLAAFDANQTQVQSVLRLAAAVMVKNIFSIEEAAFYLGYKPDYIYQLKYNGELKALPKKKRGKLYFRKADLDTYMTSGKTTEDEEYENFENDITSAWNKRERA